MSEIEKIDMSLDDIIKMNKKKARNDKSIVPSGRKGNTSASSKAQPKKARNLQVSKVKRFAGVNRRAMLKTDNTAVKGRQASKARQSLKNAVKTTQRQQRQQAVNNRRGITTAASASQARQRRTKAGLGVLQSDIVAQELEQKKKRLAFKHSIEQAKLREKKAQQLAKKKKAQELAELRRQNNLVREATLANNSGHSLTVRVRNNLAPAGGASEAMSQRKPPQSAMTRMLRHSLQQTARESAIGSPGRGGTNSRRGRVSSRRGRVQQAGEGSQMRILTNTIKQLQQQVATLQQSETRIPATQRVQNRGGKSRGGRRGRSGGSRGGGGGSRGRGSHGGAARATRTVVW